MKKLLCLLIAIISSATGFAFYSTCENEGIYVSLTGGANWLDIEKHFHSKVGFFTAGAVGYRYDNFRFEGEIGFRRNKLRLGFEKYGELIICPSRTDTFTIMAHAFYDIPINFCIRPYFGCGIGHAIHTARAKGIEGKGMVTGFAWDVIMGVTYQVTDRINLDLQFRNLNTKLHYNDHTVALGLRYQF